MNARIAVWPTRHSRPALVHAGHDGLDDLADLELLPRADLAGGALLVGLVDALLGVVALDVDLDELAFSGNVGLELLAGDDGLVLAAEVDEDLALPKSTRETVPAWVRGAWPGRRRWSRPTRRASRRCPGRQGPPRFRRQHRPRRRRAAPCPGGRANPAGRAATGPASPAWAAAPGCRRPASRPGLVATIATIVALLPLRGGLGRLAADHADLQVLRRLVAAGHRRVFGPVVAVVGGGRVRGVGLVVDVDVGSLLLVGDRLRRVGVGLGGNLGRCNLLRSLLGHGGGGRVGHGDGGELFGRSASAAATWNWGA